VGVGAVKSGRWTQHNLDLLNIIHCNRNNIVGN